MKEIIYNFESNAQAMYTLWKYTQEQTGKNIRFDDFYSAVLINFNHFERQKLTLRQCVELFE